MITNDTTTKLTGGCHCTRVRYRILGSPNKVCFCHCDSCRRMTGAPVSVAVMGARDQLEFTAANPTFYHSSENVQRGFCNGCGTPICWMGVWHDQEQMFVYAGTLDDVSLVNPDRHAFVESKPAWLMVNEHLPSFDGSSPVHIE